MSHNSGSGGGGSRFWSTIGHPSSQGENVQPNQYNTIIKKSSTGGEHSQTSNNKNVVCEINNKSYKLNTSTNGLHDEKGEGYKNQAILQWRQINQSIANHDKNDTKYNIKPSSATTATTTGIGSYSHKPNVYRTGTTGNNFVPLLPVPTPKLDWKPPTQYVTSLKSIPNSSSCLVPSKPKNKKTIENHLKLSPLSTNFEPIHEYLKHYFEQSSIFEICQQSNLIPINLIFENLFKIQKIGEGVFGEVYLCYFQNIPSVYKIVAVEGNQLVNGEKQKTFIEIQSEVIISQRLNELRDDYENYTNGFAQLVNARILQGKYPESCIESWKSWDTLNRSDNECPNFDDKQKYIIFEYEYGGKDVESFKFQNAQQSYALLTQVVHTLAVGESSLKFEHRDLHWGNILIIKTNDIYIKYILKGIEYKVYTYGIKSTIIDFTISRIKNHCGAPVFTDLSEDVEQFLGTDDYQFEIYRMMKNKNENDWSTYNPESNIYWCHYLVDKLLTKGRYLDTLSKSHHFYMKKLSRFKDIILKFSSCCEFVLNSPREC